MLASVLWAMVDRYPGETFFPTGQMIASGAQSLLCHPCCYDRDHRSRTLSPAHEHLPPLRAHDDQSAGPSLAGAPREFATALALAPECKAP
jgi:hypothetical protein